MTVIRPLVCAADQVDEALVRVIADRGLASRLFAQESGLWGRQAEATAQQALGWLTMPPPAGALIDRACRLRSELLAEGVDDFVLCGMGGNALAARAMAHAAALPLTVLDTIHPDAVLGVIDRDLSRTAVIISSKSGTTIETDALLRVFSKAFAVQGITPGRRLVAVTDPGSVLAGLPSSDYRELFLADPQIGGRYSSLSAFGVVPVTLAGGDTRGLLAAAEAAVPSLLADDPANPALRLAAVLGNGSATLALSDEADGALADWVEQLVAESLGKDGRGVLPVVGTSASNSTGFDDAMVRFGTGSTGGSLGGLFLLWQCAVAIAGSLLELNPFDQPDVEAAKAATRQELAEPRQRVPALQEPGVRVFGDVRPSDTVEQAVAAFVGGVPSDGYLAIMAYADPADGRPGALRLEAERDCSGPVTFGWGPRFLHSTGQYHKGGPANGAFVQVVADSDRDLPVPGRPYSLGTLIKAQAAGDSTLLRQLGRPVLELHLDTKLG